MNYHGEKNQIDKKLVLLGIAISAIIGMALMLVTQIQLPSGQETQKDAFGNSLTANIELINEIEKSGFYFHICGDEVDPAKIAGTPENPAILRRGQGEVTIPFCAKGTDVKQNIWYLKPEGRMGAKLDDGLHVNMEKEYLDMPAYLGTEYDAQLGKGNLDNFNINVSADNKAELGIHYFYVNAENFDDTGVSSLNMGQVVAIDIVE